jgi:hypothetical protein
MQMALGTGRQVVARVGASAAARVCRGFRREFAGGAVTWDMKGGGCGRVDEAAYVVATV